jgi:hypothetical protein
MRTTALLFACTVALGACSSNNSSSGAASDAGQDAAFDAGSDSSFNSGFPPDDSGPGPGPGPVSDAGSKCSDLAAAAQQKATVAAACDPLLGQQCGGTTPGICCPLTITNGADPSAVDDYNAAVNAFKNAGCTVDCTKIPCGTAPSNTCTGTGHVGVCK